MSSNRPVINLNSFSSIFDAFYFSNDPEKMLKPKRIPGSKYGPYQIELSDFGAQPNSVSGMDASQAQRIALELTGGQDRQLTTKTVTDFLRESLSGVERETQGGALSAMTGYTLPKGHISSLDYSKKTRPLSLVFGNPGDLNTHAGGHWQEGSFKVWLKNQQDMSYSRSQMGHITRHETGHVVSSSIEQNVRMLQSEIGRGKAGPDLTFFDAAGQRILPPLEDETLRYSWMREKVLASYRKEAVLPSHMTEMMFRAMEQNARDEHIRGFSSISAIPLSTK